MKILASNSGKVKFKELDFGTAFYDECGKMYMKVNENELLQNAVSLSTGCLWSFDKDSIVTKAHVHIEDD